MICRSKVDLAIAQAYEALEYAWRFVDNAPEYNILLKAMRDLRPFYRNPSATYDDVRRQYWIETMDANFDGHLKDFTDEEITQMLDWLENHESEEMYDSVECIPDVLYEALSHCGLLDKVFGEE